MHAIGRALLTLACLGAGSAALLGAWIAARIAGLAGSQGFWLLTCLLLVYAALTAFGALAAWIERFGWIRVTHGALSAVTAGALALASLTLDVEGPETLVLAGCGAALLAAWLALAALHRKTR